MATVLFALGASTAWGLADFLGGLRARSVPLPALLVVSQAAGLAVLAPALLVGGGAIPGDPRLWLGLLAGLTAVADLGLIYLVLARGPVILIAPIAAVGASIPVAVGLFGGDPIDPRIAAGLALALAGSLAASFERRGEHGCAGLPGTLPLALGAALAVGATLILLERASLAGPLWATGAMRAGGFGASLALVAVVWLRRGGARRLPGASPTRGRGRSSGRPAPEEPSTTAHPNGPARFATGAGLALAASLATVGIFDALADVGYTLAASRGHLSTVSVLASLYPVVTVVLGVTVLRERVATLQLVGVALAIAGVALLAGAA